MNQILSVAEHRRDQAGLTYVYPVVSRRAGGLSIGINLNINKACNWACVYCQVEGLSRGGPAPVRLDQLEEELAGFLQQVLHGNYLNLHVPENCRRLADLAFSGDGEPTSAAEFSQAVERVGQVWTQAGLTGVVPIRLITNGSLMHRRSVQQGLQHLATLGGEVWFKLDRGDAAGIWKVNKTRLRKEQIRAHLECCARLAPTWVQTCWFGWQGRAPGEIDEKHYLEMLKPMAGLIRGVHLYGLARPSMQPEADQLLALPEASLRQWGAHIETETGIKVMVSP